MVMDFISIDKIMENRRLDPVFFGLAFFNKQIPFQLVPLKSFCADFQSGFGAGKEEQAAEENGVIQIRPANIDSEGTLKYDKNIFVPDSSDKSLLEIDDIVFNNTNSRELVGMTAILKEKRKLFFSDYITRIRAKKEKILPDYLWIILNIYQRRNIFYSICTNWNNQSGVSIELLKSLKIPLPPKEIQQQIAAVYNHAIKEKQAKERKSGALLADIDDYLLKELGMESAEKAGNTRYFEVNIPDLTGKRWDPIYYSFDCMRGVHTPPFRALKKGMYPETNTLPKQHTPSLQGGVVDFSRFQNKYPMMPLDSFCLDFQSGFGAGKEDMATEENGIIQIRPADIDNEGDLRFGKNIFIPSSLNKPLLEIDDVLFNNTNSRELVGKTSILKENIKLFFSNHITRIKVDKTKVIPDYLWITLNLYQKINVFYSICANWNNQSSIGIELLKSMKIPFPPIEKQREIAGHIRSVRAKAKQLQEDAKELMSKTKTEIEKIIIGE